MVAATSLFLKHHESLPVGRTHPKLGAIRPYSRTRHSSASKCSQCVLGKIYAKAAGFELRFACSGIFWRDSFCHIGNCQDATFLDASQASVVRTISISRLWPPRGSGYKSCPAVKPREIGFSERRLLKGAIRTDKRGPRNGLDKRCSRKPFEVFWRGQPQGHPIWLRPGCDPVHAGRTTQPGYVTRSPQTKRASKVVSLRP